MKPDTLRVLDVQATEEEVAGAILEALRDLDAASTFHDINGCANCRDKRVILILAQRIAQIPETGTDAASIARRAAEQHGIALAVAGNARREQDRPLVQEGCGTPEPAPGPTASDDLSPIGG